jgi:oligopeptide/dipeptide ABC transporter ATP-binding protein
MEPLLEVKNLYTYFDADQGAAYAIEGVSFNIDKGQTLALVGESGCGKTVTALSIMGLLPKPAGRIAEGSILFRDRQLVDMPEDQMRAIRGRRIGMIFQEPLSSLNPLYTAGYQIGEALMAHSQEKANKRQVKDKVLRLLQQVEMPSPEQRYYDYPHNLSGGLRQRVMIAQALACGPSLLIADEPTTALDVTIQAQILRLFAQLKESSQMSILLITHDLGIVAEIADRVCIMYCGRIMEEADVSTIFNEPKHPYTQGLLNSMPARQAYLRAAQEDKAQQKLFAIPGTVPHAWDRPAGCPFYPRCYKADQRCASEKPEILSLTREHQVSCWKALKELK